MADYTELLSSLPLDDIARALGTDPETAQSAVATAIPALLGGLQANTADSAGAASLLEALSEHSPDLVESGPSLDKIDVADGEKIVQNIFGSNTTNVAARLGSSQGTGSSLFQRLLPILAPIVLSYLTKKLTAPASTAGSVYAQESQQEPSGGGLFGGLLGSLFGGGEPEPAPVTTQQAGTSLYDLLGGLLGASGAPLPRTSPTQTYPGGMDDLLGTVLGGLLGGGKR